MKTSLSHLPQIKQEQILQIVKIIKEVAAPEKVILFGSHATNTWVEHRYFENGTDYEYISDYDFLIVTKNSVLKEYDIIDKIVNRSRSLFKTPVNAIIHDVKYVNEGLEIGQYFFTDIINEGVLLSDNETIEFSSPRILSKEEMKSIAQMYYDIWFVDASDFIDGVLLYLDKKKFKKSVFLLHQAAEHFYNTVLLVFTGYKPKTHNLDKLRHYAKQLSQELFTIFPFPIDDSEEIHLFELLKRGYVDARYKNDYSITEEELKKLIDRIYQMQAVVQKICTEYIDTLNG
ncbi:HEPN domain-containing protein [Ginsengibacter hankyongi]|uniref:HEPN domain-containing protein n=1 Tax=Ginsengibacter hankyongi TaxID=2607284 RepID=A0A5J5IK14_9BACT|nr:HEPN domain-containing protein [Ginsengibacter hankyongi]KAA9038735.1 HEPN domain-containing protein [Ginsengibacter hankyongi]